MFSLACKNVLLGGIVEASTCRVHRTTINGTHACHTRKRMGGRITTCTHANDTHTHTHMHKNTQTHGPPKCGEAPPRSGTRTSRSIQEVPAATPEAAAAVV